MNMNEYQALAMRTSNAQTRSDKVENGVLGLNGEAGEVADLLKKYLFQGHELDRNKLVDEMGDVLWYLAELSDGLDVPLAEVARRNIEKLRERYPDGFDRERSMHRPEYGGADAGGYHG